MPLLAVTRTSRLSKCVRGVPCEVIGGGAQMSSGMRNPTRSIAVMVTLMRSPAGASVLSEGFRFAPSRRRSMYRAASSALAVLVLTTAALPAQADECDDTIRALNERMDQIRKTRKEGDSHTTICARLGRISGL